MVIGSSFIRRVLAALIVGASSSAALAQTEAPHPYRGAASAPVFISTINLASTAQFFPLPTNYNTLFVNCQGMLNGTGNGYNVLVGEGGTPTWETGAHYTIVRSEISAVGGQTISGGTVQTSIETPPLSTVTAGSLSLYIGNVASTSLAKIVTFTSTSIYDPDGRWYYENGSGYWNNDTNPITGIQLVPTPSGGFAGGTCSLYGMN